MKGNTARLKEIIISNILIILAIMFIFFFWILESLIDTYIFNLYNDFLSAMFTTDANEVWLRLFIVSSFMVFSVISQKIIIKQKVTQKKLKESEELYFTTLKSIGDAVITTDLNGNVSFLNEVAAILTGWTLRESLGKPVTKIFKIVNEQTHKPIENPIARVLKEGIIVGIGNHSVLITKDEKEIPIDDSGAPIKDDKGNITGVVLIFRDITERKRAEQVYRESQKIRQERLIMLGQLAGGVGHELRNPLGAMKNAVYFLNLSLENPDPDVKEVLDVLSNEISNSEMIINSLLGFANPKPPILQKVVINEILQTIFDKLIIPENIEVVKNFDENIPIIVGDPFQLAHTFRNIIVNAFQAMLKGGTLIINTNMTNSKYLTVSFEDTGIGIKKENMDKLFEPLFTTKAKGIGLGLSISKLMIKNHNGTIDITSEEGIGTTFKIELPIQRRSEGLN
ncbi:hypothetical protein LCGC14_1786740 [marine sediment metagenome]|uniref:Histidine kinase domain-containing protein n=1 Tax=marine sediment metagenome TaxID=412755 RepID=A0A0F9HGB2_9ZZZZ